MELNVYTPELIGRAYPILASQLTSRPIALVTMVDAECRVNAAPFSFFNMTSVSCVGLT